jgi:hypothetical protein
MHATDRPLCPAAATWRDGIIAVTAAGGLAR